MKKALPIIVFFVAVLAGLIYAAPAAQAAFPTVDIKANGSDGPVSIPYNTSANLTWTSTDATSCNIVPTNTVGTSGSVSTGNLTEGRYFIVECGGPEGYANDFVYIDIPKTNDTNTNNSNNNNPNNNPNNNQSPTVTMSAYPQDVNPGESATLTWSSANAYYCSASVNWSGNKDISGSETVYPSMTTTYILTCYSHNGQSAMAQATVFMHDQHTSPVITFTADPQSITQGQTSYLSWHSANAISCTATDSWSGELDTTGWLTVSPSVTTTYTITCSNNYGTTQDSQTVTVAPAANSNPNSNPSQITQRALNHTLNQTTFSDSVVADGLDTIEFQIRVRNVGPGLTTLTVRDVLPQELYYVSGSTMIDGSSVGDGIAAQGLSLPSVNAGEEKVIEFRAVVFSGAAVGMINNQGIVIEPSGNRQSASLTITIRHRGKVLGVSDVTTGPEDILPWVFFFGLVGSILMHVIIFRKSRVKPHPIVRIAKAAAGGAASLFQNKSQATAVKCECEEMIAKIRALEKFPDTDKYSKVIT